MNKNKVQLTCMYCGNSWEINYYPKEVQICFQCKDTNIKAIEIAAKIDYYAGSPPFEEDDSDHNKWYI